MTEARSGGRTLSTWLWRSALPLWREAGMDRRRGGFEEGLGFDGRPVDMDRRLRVQARQTWVYATAHRLDPTGGWGEPALHGLHSLTQLYRRADGLHHPAVTPDGVAIEGPALVYDQAFVLLALAALYRAGLPDLEVATYADALATKIVDTFAHAGGYREDSGETPFYANPNMHLLEAFLEWEEAEPEGRWGALADELAALAVARFFDPDLGVLREHFAADWSPAPGVNGRVLDVGHQYEWSWLLRRWGRARGRADAVIAADRLLSTGSRFGVDPARGVAFNTMLDDFTPLDRNARLWPQTERLKAITLAARDTVDPGERQRLEAEAGEAAKGLELYFQTDVEGLWRDLLTPGGAFLDRYSPGSSLYHIAGAILALDEPPSPPLADAV